MYENFYFTIYVSYEYNKIGILHIRIKRSGTSGLQEEITSSAKN